MSLVTTPVATNVIRGGVGEGIVANDAHELAGITYRQLDHWARQGWVRPSLDPGRGRAGRRLYSLADVIRLDLLRHLAMSRVNTAQAGPRVSELDIPGGDRLVVWGPVGDKDADAHLLAVDRTAVVGLLSEGGAWVVYDPDPVRARIARVASPPLPHNEARRRRSA